MIKPCLTEQGIGRTSMTLSGPMRVSVRMVVFMFVLIFLLQLKVSDTGAGAANISHHRRMPRRVPDDFDSDITHAFQREQRVLHAPRNAFVHRATRRRERHRHIHLRADDLNAVNQTQVHDVAAEFGINHLPQRLADNLFVEWSGTHKAPPVFAGCNTSGSILGRTKRVRILPKFSAKTPRLNASRLHPKRTPTSLPSTVAALVTASAVT